MHPWRAMLETSEIHGTHGKATTSYFGNCDMPARVADALEKLTVVARRHVGCLFTQAGDGFTDPEVVDRRVVEWLWDDEGCFGIAIAECEHEGLSVWAGLPVDSGRLIVGDCMDPMRPEMYGAGLVLGWWLTRKMLADAAKGLIDRVDPKPAAFKDILDPLVQSFLDKPVDGAAKT